ncbi:methyl-accepting chemotaxis protein [Sphingobium subterraneum]|uniref:Methyl-accepting chemotaxis protein n=1 Tax=Sphingobium subterraneum TaxID=627688 RepID=A0A841IX07_9SPHN|nr:methyl-accepting chemotaxis protein [Sphingobium subterraneum]MBB6123193.1 methyl-accepting chemotaxis protein [Sphingobium subterraneum]
MVRRGNIFGRLPFAAMLSLVLILGLIPAVLLGNLFIQQSLTDVKFAQQEKSGLDYLRPVWRIYMHQQAGTVTAADIAALKKAGLQYDRQFDTSDESRRLVELLEENPENDASASIEATETLMEEIGDHSHLVLDPDLDTYYLMDIVLLRSRGVMDALAERGTDDVPDNTARRDILRAVLSLKESVKRATEGNLDGSVGRSPLKAQSQQLATAARTYLNHPSRTTAEAFAKENDQLWSVTAHEMNRLLDVRITKLQDRLRFNLGVSGTVLLVVLVLAFLVIRALSGSLNRISHRVARLSEGDYASPVPGTDLHNDVGIIARALEDFVSLTNERQTLEATLLREREQSRVELEATITRVNAENRTLLDKVVEQQKESRANERRALTSLAADLEAHVSVLVSAARDAATRLDQSVNAMTDETATTQHQAEAAALAARQIRDTVDGVAVSIVAISTQLKALREQSEEGRTMADSTIESVDRATARIADFEEAADRVEAMQMLIANVANQTNLLALNASIEAARVGEAGKGFMVVADEVKSLAQSTRKATQDIADQMAGMRHAHAAVVAAFQSIFDAIRHLSLASRSISHGIDEQTDRITVVEQAIHAASGTVSGLCDSIAQADHSAADASRASRQIAADVGGVVDQLATLDQTFATFTRGMKEAQSVDSIAA